MKKNLKKQYIIGFIVNFIIIAILIMLELHLYSKLSNLLTISAANDFKDLSEVIIGVDGIILIVNSFILFIYVAAVIGSLIGLVKGYIVGKYVLTKEERKIKLDNPYIYFRELPNKFGIGVATLLIDSEIEYSKDVVAAILDLCAKDYLKLEKIGDTYKLKVINSNISDLLSNEKYIMEHVLSNNIKKIDYNTWYNLCADDGIKLGLFNKRDTKDKFKKYRFKYSFLTHILLDVLVTLILIGVISPYLGNDNRILVFILLMFILFFVVYIPYAIFGAIYQFYRYGKNQQNVMYKHILNSSLLKTDMGIEELHQLYAFKKFIKDFGVFVDKRIEEVTLWEYYLSYAQLFGLTNLILKTGYKQLTNNKSFIIDNIDDINLNNIEMESKDMNLGFLKDMFSNKESENTTDLVNSQVETIKDGDTIIQREVQTDPNNPNVQRIIEKKEVHKTLSKEEFEQFMKDHPNVQVKREVKFSINGDEVNKQ